MASRPIVGVTGSARRWAPAWWCTRLALWRSGAKAVRFSLNHSVAENSLAALVIGRGNDIGPEHYDGDVDAKVRLDPECDQLEIDWIKFAFQEDLPRRSADQCSSRWHPEDLFYLPSQLKLFRWLLRSGR